MIMTSTSFGLEFEFAEDDLPPTPEQGAVARALASFAPGIRTPPGQPVPTWLLEVLHHRIAAGELAEVEPGIFRRSHA
jgi:hypothetical protein